MARVKKERDLKHGTPSAYAKGCRCEACKAGHSDRMKHYRAQRTAMVAAGDSRVPHGTDSGYFNWGCRCERCKAVGSIGNRKRREKRDGGGQERHC